MHGQVRSNHHVSSNHFGGSEEHQQHGDKHGSKPSSATSAAAVAAIKTKDTLKDFLKKYGKIGVLTYGAVSVVSCTFWYLAFKYGLDIGPITKDQLADYKASCSTKINMEYFKIHQPEETNAENAGDGVVFHFPDIKTASSSNGVTDIAVRTLVRHFTSMKQASQIPAPSIYLVYGKLTAISLLFAQFNQELLDGSISSTWSRFVKHQVLQLTSSFGFAIQVGNRIECSGLAELLAGIESIYEADIKAHKEMIKSSSIVFDSLHHLYKSGSIVSSATSLGVPSAFRVVQCWYQQHRTLFGLEKSFHLELQFIVGLGTEYAVCQFESVYSQWMGAASRSIQELLFVPASSPSELQAFQANGQKYRMYSSGGIRFLQHDAASVYLHSSSSDVQRRKTGMLHSPGRIMIDVLKGSQLGIHASQGMDDATLAMMELIKRYRRLLNERKSQANAAAVSSSDAMLILSDIPECLFAISWPALVGFSFSAKSWCHVLVAGLSDISFNDKAFDQLVLDKDRKQLIRALVKFGSGSEHFSDIIAGKSGGSIFLLHGPPGCGKTLTAEAIAEVLHRPLYYVTMGELGVTPETMESRLESILDLCSSWDAIALIDEADVFLEKRSTSDVLRNAMVCVMLRLLEYHQGILILTTNRVTEFDPAFESRVTVALKYDSLDQESRKKVWKNLLSRLSFPKNEVSLDLNELSVHELNGRQIKNACRLAVALAADAGVALDQKVCLRALAAANMGRIDMNNAEKY